MIKNIATMSMSHYDGKQYVYFSQIENCKVMHISINDYPDTQKECTEQEVHIYVGKEVKDCKYNSETNQIVISLV